MGTEVICDIYHREIKGYHTEMHLCTLAKETQLNKDS